jgi:hypothetical protein
MDFQVPTNMIIEPITLADELQTLLNAKNPNGGYVLRKENRLPVIQAEFLLRQLFKHNQ